MGRTIYVTLMPSSGEGSSMIDMTDEEEEWGIESLMTLFHNETRKDTDNTEKSTQPSVAMSMEDLVKLVVTLLKDKGDKRVDQEITADVKSWLSQNLKFTINKG